MGDQRDGGYDWYVPPNFPLKLGLPEYRNGGLLVDLGLLTLTDKAKSEAISENEGIYKFSPSSQTVIEWRAITVIALYVFFLLPLSSPSFVSSRQKRAREERRDKPDEQGQDRRRLENQAGLQLHSSPSLRERDLEMWATHRSRKEKEWRTTN